MKKYLILLLAAGTLASCKGRNAAKQAEKAEVSAAQEMHNAQNSLDYVGTYKATLPCADCEGIETTVTLDRDGNYTRTTKYLGKDDDKLYEESGKYVWVENGSTIELDVPSKPNSYFVAENSLIHLDENGQRIAGDLAEMYILKNLNQKSANADLQGQK